MTLKTRKMQYWGRADQISTCPHTCKFKEVSIYEDEEGVGLSGQKESRERRKIAFPSIFNMI